MIHKHRDELIVGTTNRRSQQLDILPASPRARFENEIVGVASFGTEVLYLIRQAPLNWAQETESLRATHHQRAHECFFLLLIKRWILLVLFAYFYEDFLMRAERNG